MNELKRLINEEFEKWSSKSYEELLKLGPEFKHHHYEINKPTSYLNVVVSLLERTPEYLHPLIEIQATRPKQNKTLWQRIMHGGEFEDVTYDWIVYKDGRIDK